MTPARAQQAPAPPDLGPAYFTKEKDPKDPKKERPSKTVRRLMAEIPHSRLRLWITGGNDLLPSGRRRFIRTEVRALASLRIEVGFRRIAVGVGELDRRRHAGAVGKGALLRYYSRPDGNTYNVTFSGDSTELWVDPETGQTKWVEVGSDYKPVDPPQGWVELVPRKQPPETPPERPVATTETPPRTPTPRTPETPTTETPRTPTTETPPRTPTTDTPPPRTPETPPTQTTDVPPKTPTSDDIPSTVFVKANEEVVRGEPTGQPLASQIVKLLAERPALPSSRESRTAQDTGFDKPPAQCTTGADGRCKFEVPADERPVYGLPVTDTAARRPNYRVEFNALKSSGGVAEITGRTPAAERTPTDGGNIASDTFNIGNRTFQRFGFNTPYESREDVEASYRQTFGDRYQVDTCETKKLPGLPLGIEPSSFNEPNHELSRATIKLDRTARSGRTSR